MGKVIFRPHIGPHKTCGIKLNVQRARARAIVSPSVNVPFAPARDLGAYACFAARPRATLAPCCPRARARHCALLCSGMHRVCVRDWTICAKVEFKIAVVVFVQVLLLLGGVRLHGNDC